MSNAREHAAPREPEWRPRSSPGIRRLALEATRAAVKAAKDRRTNTTQEPTK